MEVSIRKWGDSMGLRLPASLCRQLKIIPGIKMTLTVQDNHIFITPKKSKLDTLLNDMKPKTFHKDLVNDQPTGSEAW